MHAPPLLADRRGFQSGDCREISSSGRHADITIFVMKYNELCDFQSQTLGQRWTSILLQLIGQTGHQARISADSVAIDT